MAPATDYRERFARFAVRAGLLRFGNFTTKSGRPSPYFFNTGGCADGAALSELGGCYAATIGQIVDVLSREPVDGRTVIDAELRGHIEAYLQQYAPRSR